MAGDKDADARLEQHLPSASIWWWLDRKEHVSKARIDTGASYCTLRRMLVQRSKQLGVF